MPPLDIFWHLANLFMPALMLAGLAPALAKLLWRRELAGVRWSRLAGPVAVANALVVLAALVMTGHDGRMAMYGALVVTTALTLWWRGFVRRAP